MAEEIKKRAYKPLYVVAGVVLLVLIFGLFKVFGPATPMYKGDNNFVYIHTGDDYEKVKNAVSGTVSDMWSFNIVARLVGLPSHIHPGKYKVKSLMSNYSLVRLLRSGKQTQVNLVINKLRTKSDFVTLISSNLEVDSNALRQMINDPVLLKEYNLDTNTVMCAIIPNTYFFKWNTPADKVFRKLAANYVHFWDDAHRQQAKAHGLTPSQAIIVASIVDEETNMQDDKPKIASVYLNRLDKGMKLQADPTVKFAVGDFTIKRVAGQMLQNPSPYNTYLYTGLPPGPICTPAISSIEAVLQSPATTYLYFCAKEDFSGYSNFASTYDEQLKNAHKYQKALDARGIH